MCGMLSSRVGGAPAPSVESRELCSLRLQRKLYLLAGCGAGQQRQIQLLVLMCMGARGLLSRTAVAAVAPPRAAAVRRSSCQALSM